MNSKIRIALTSLVIVLSLFMSGGLYVYSSFQRIQDDTNIGDDTKKTTTEEEKDETSTTDKKYDTVDGITNILLVGVDDRLNSNSSTGVMADAIMIATIDTVHNKLKLTSIMRDTYVTIPGHGNTKINHSHSYGGIELLIKTIESNFEIPIDHYAKINFQGFKDVIDVMGGITITIENKEMLNELNRCLLLEKYEDPKFKDSKFMKIVDKANLLFDRESYPGTPYIKDNKNTSEWEYNYIADKANFINSTGEITLNGAQALAYSRMRHNVNGSVGRTSRQREVISLAAEKVSKLPLTKYVPLAETIIPHIKTNISMTTGLSLATTALEINNFNIETLQLPPEKLSEGVIVDKSFIYENVSTYVFLIDSKNTAEVAQDFIFNDISYDESKYSKFNYLNAGYFSPRKEPTEEKEENSDTLKDNEDVDSSEDNTSNDPTNENSDSNEDSQGDNTDNNSDKENSDENSEGDNSKENSENNSSNSNTDNSESNSTNDAAPTDSGENSSNSNTDGSTNSNNQNSSQNNKENNSI